MGTRVEYDSTLDEIAELHLRADFVETARRKMRAVKADAGDAAQVL